MRAYAEITDRVFDPANIIVMSSAVYDDDAEIRFKYLFVFRLTYPRREKATVGETHLFDLFLKCMSGKW